jgi:hypothetical protein
LKVFKGELHRPKSDSALAEPITHSDCLQVTLGLRFNVISGNWSIDELLGTNREAPGLTMYLRV